MPLQYIIDGYNIINHPLFIKLAPKKTSDSRFALLSLIRQNHLTKSVKNKITLVFDGYPADSFAPDCALDNASIVFSRKISADERIKKMVEESGRRSEIIVVSDDKEIRCVIKQLGAKALGVEDFLGPKKHINKDAQDLIKPELSFCQTEEINKELRKLWLGQA